MSNPARPRPILASFAASALWLGPWIVLMLCVGERNNDNAVGFGLFVFMIPAALVVGALVWRTVGMLLREGPPSRNRFMIRSALIVAGFVLLLKLWGLWGIWDAPPPVRYGEAIFLSLATVAALGVSALPAAATWWQLAIRPAVTAELLHAAEQRQ
jgi:hypothetical protein